MNRNRVEIVGCIGSGKTTLCNTLKNVGWHAVYEPFEKNPFIIEHYKGLKCSFELQMCFLLQHYNEAKKCIPYENNICDFSFALDSIYANLLLNDLEKETYHKLLKYITMSIEPPSHIIKLTCPDDILIQRIKKRNRDFEKNIDPDFIRCLNKEISYFSTEIECIEIDTHKIDVSNVDNVYSQIISHL